MEVIFFEDLCLLSNVNLDQCNLFQGFLCKAANLQGMKIEVIKRLGLFLPASTAAILF